MSVRGSGFPPVYAIEAEQRKSPKSSIGLDFCILQVLPGLWFLFVCFGFVLVLCLFVFFF